MDIINDLSSDLLDDAKEYITKIMENAATQSENLWSIDITDLEDPTPTKIKVIEVLRAYFDDLYECCSKRIQEIERIQKPKDESKTISSRKNEIYVKFLEESC